MAQVRRIRTIEEKLHIEFTPEEVSETVVAAALQMTSDEGWKLLDARIDEYRGATVILVREDVE